MSCLCDQCAALCCRYFALPIDNPEDKRDYDNIRWYLLHEKVVIFIEKSQWYIGILNRCKQLQSDNRCGIYLTRPAICRSYTTDNCDYHAGDYGYDQLFTSAEGLWEYALKTLAEEKKARAEKAKRKRLKLRQSKVTGKNEAGKAAASKGSVSGKSKLKRGLSLGSKARKLSQTRSLPADVFNATSAARAGDMAKLVSGKNSRSLALPLLTR